MRISDWSSDVCSSDLTGPVEDIDPHVRVVEEGIAGADHEDDAVQPDVGLLQPHPADRVDIAQDRDAEGDQHHQQRQPCHAPADPLVEPRSEEHTSELQSLMRNSYAVFCLKKKKY